MKIYFNRRPVDGPWGGGSKILSKIVTESLRRSHSVFFEEELVSNGPYDVMFCADPRDTPLISYREVLKFKQNFSKTKLVQRIGDLGTHGKPELLDLVKATSSHSDALVFPSQWAKDYLSSLHPCQYVIQNAALEDFVDSQEKCSLYDSSDCLKIVTHHWSNNQMKGFDVYEKLDNFCLERGKSAQFTFIGRKPDNIKITNHIQPLDVASLIRELPKHNFYVTASKEEAGANHVLEAMSLGLHVFYGPNGGSINEYCSNKSIGTMYTDFNHLAMLLSDQNNLKTLSKSAIDFSKRETRSTSDVSREYVDLFESFR